MEHPPNLSHTRDTPLSHTYPVFYIHTSFIPAQGDIFELIAAAARSRQAKPEGEEAGGCGWSSIGLYRSLRGRRWGDVDGALQPWEKLRRELIGRGERVQDSNNVHT